MFISPFYQLHTVFLYTNHIMIAARVWNKFIKNASKITQQSTFAHYCVLTVVDHALLGENHEQAVDLKDAHTRSDNHRHLASAVKVAVDVVLVKHCGRGEVVG